MAEVKWVKLTTDMFDNRKIKHLRKLPEGNNIVLIWVMLLTMAGRCNSGGMIFLTENIPYTPKMLADELDFEENTVALALQVLEQLDMIVTDNGFFTIAGWEEYQNIEGLNKIREQTRKRVAKCREKKLLAQGSVTSNVTVTQGNDIDVDLDKEKDLDIFTTTTTEAAPTLTEVYMYFRSCMDEDYISEAEKFHAYNAKRGWDCLPEWEATADLWIARIGEQRKVRKE
jgi:predicted phage replisome organizer